jgi:hypothetical protein
VSGGSVLGSDNHHRHGAEGAGYPRECAKRGKERGVQNLNCRSGEDVGEGLYDVNMGNV